MLLTLTFQDSHAMWYAYRTYFKEIRWDQKRQREMTNCDLGLGPDRLWQVSRTEREIKIQIKNDPGPETFFRFDGLIGWSIQTRPDNVIELPVPYSQQLAANA